MPEFRIEYLVERARFERVRRGETNHMAAKITRHVTPAPDFRQRARRKRFINFVALVRLETHELAGRQTISRSADLSVDRIRKKIDEADTVILQLRRSN